MNLVVFGATGGTGKEAVKQALARGYSVTAFVRDPARLPVQDAALRVVVGDVLNLEDVTKAVAGQDAAVVALGSSDRSDRTTRSEGTANVIQAMKSQQLSRLVVVSAIGTGDSYRQVPFFMKTIMKTVLRNAYADHELQERYVRESDLDWIIVRPAGLTDGPQTGQYYTGTAEMDLAGGQVSRADVATFALQQLSDDRYLRQAVSIA